ncbi:hypothetical protein ATANTOWER_003386, partial [Ataeniobius toweri]|nr:hypothetical protein [Ataeniobius toweri]
FPRKTRTVPGAKPSGGASIIFTIIISSLQRRPSSAAKMQTFLRGRRVGYWLSEKKTKKLNFQAFADLCRKRGIEVVQCGKAVHFVPHRNDTDGGKKMFLMTIGNTPNPSILPLLSPLLFQNTNRNKMEINIGYLYRPSLTYWTNTDVNSTSFSCILVTERSPPAGLWGVKTKKAAKQQDLFPDLYVGSNRLLPLEEFSSGHNSAPQRHFIKAGNILSPDLPSPTTIRLFSVLSIRTKAQRCLSVPQGPSKTSADISAFSI